MLFAATLPSTTNSTTAVFFSVLTATAVSAPSLQRLQLSLKSHAPSTHPD